MKKQLALFRAVKMVISLTSLLGGASRLVAIAALALALVPNQQAAEFVFNGDFALSTPAGYPAGLEAANGWMNLSGLQFQASAAPAGFENTPSTSKFLRLVNDEGQISPGNIGMIAQDLGTMTTGEIYTFSGTAFNTADVNASINPFEATISLRSGSATGPILASTSVNIATPGGFAFPSFNYASLLGDDGVNLFLRLDAAASPAGTITRGGFDDLSVTTAAVPEPAAIPLVVGLALAAMAWGNRRRRHAEVVTTNQGRAVAKLMGDSTMIPGVELNRTCLSPSPFSIMQVP